MNHTREISFMFEIPVGEGSAADRGYQTVSLTLPVSWAPTNALEYSALIAVAEVLRRGEADMASRGAVLTGEITIAADEVASLFQTSFVNGMGPWNHLPLVDQPLAITIETQSAQGYPASIRIHCESHGDLRVTVRRLSASRYEVEIVRS
jgi:hypothetical protein